MASRRLELTRGLHGFCKIGCADATWVAVKANPAPLAGKRLELLYHFHLDYHATGEYKWQPYQNVIGFYAQ
jgi:hypothetical protein